MLLAAMAATGIWVVAGCGGDGSGGSSPQEDPNALPVVTGVMPQKVRLELDSLDCATSLGIIENSSEDLYFDAMASYASGQIGGSEAEWRAAFDWWWQGTCGK